MSEHVESSHSITQVSVDRCPVALSRDLLLRLAPEDMKQCILSLGLVDGIVHAGAMEGANT